MKVFGGSGNNSKRNKRRAQEEFGKERPKKKSRALKVVLIVVLVIAAIVGGVALYLVISTKPPAIDNDNDPAESHEPEAPADVNRYYTVLAIGEDQEKLNTDTIMVVRLDTQEHTVNVVSIPRDTLVNIPESVKKVNGVFHSQMDGGMDRLMDEVEKICGFRPNNYVIVDMDAFEEIIDDIGGVDFDVPIDMTYTHWNELTGEEFQINVKKGPQTLNGHDALSVWRFRQNDDKTGYPNGDMDRISVQHDLMKAIAKQVMSLGIADLDKLLKVASTAARSCTTDLEVGNVQWFAMEFLKMDSEDLTLLTAPVLNCYVGASKRSYATLMAEEWVEMVNAHLNPYTNEISKDQLEIVYLARYEIASDGFIYAKTEDMAVTNGAELNTNFY